MALTAGQQKLALYALIFLGLLIASAVIYYVWIRDECDPNNNGFTKKGKPSDKCRVNKPTEAVPSGSPTSTWITEAFPLNMGMYGSRIKLLQQKVGIGADGKFGKQTTTALIAKGYTVPLSEADYNTIIGTSTSSTGTSTSSTGADNNQGGVNTPILDGDWNPKKAEIDTYIGTQLKSNGNMTAYFASDKKPFREYLDGQNIGILGKSYSNLGRMIENAIGDTSWFGVYLKDADVEKILGIK